MDGPTQQRPVIEENMRALSLKDIVILKMFLEKANRAGIFLETEKQSVAIVHTKLTNLIQDVAKKQEEAKANLPEEKKA
jgi:hypothetical protein